MKALSLILGFLSITACSVIGQEYYLLERETIPNYPCYRTVEGTFAAAQAIENSYPHLAQWIDVGDSWEKTVGEGGWDLMVLKLTNRFIAGPKPILFTTSAIHAREYATAELMTRFAEHLVANYGLDADITWMLDYHEVHLLLVLNPDGRKKAEPQVMWRKNTNRNYCGSNSNDRGVDLNRNFDYQWGSVGSSSQCSETYRGPSAASEPETQAVQNYMRSIFPDRRGPGSSAVAPKDYMGIYFDIHSYGEIIYQPRGTPNDKEITTFNRKLGFFNGYRPVLDDRHLPVRRNWKTDPKAAEPHGRTYTYSFGYGDLGVPSYLFELGTSFFQSCQYFEQNIVPGNIEALEFGLKVARAAYQLPAGPEAIELEIQGNRISAQIDDTRYSSRSGTESTQNIAAAEAYIDSFPWIEGAIPISLSPTDGNFDEKTEEVGATLNTTPLVPGRHLVSVRGKDADGNWGPISAIFLEIQASPP